MYRPVFATFSLHVIFQVTNKDWIPQFLQCFQQKGMDLLPVAVPHPTGTTTWAAGKQRGRKRRMENKRSDTMRARKVIEEETSEGKMRLVTARTERGGCEEQGRLCPLVWENTNCWRFKSVCVCVCVSPWAASSVLPAAPSAPSCSPAATTSSAPVRLSSVWNTHTLQRLAEDRSWSKNRFKSQNVEKIRNATWKKNKRLDLQSWSAKTICRSSCVMRLINRWIREERCYWRACRRVFPGKKSARLRELLVRNPQCFVRWQGEKHQVCLRTSN